MPNLVDNSSFDSDVYEFATTDLIQGGPGGVDNVPHQQLANRTRWLKDEKLQRDGSIALTNNLNAGTYRIMNMAPAVNTGQALTYGQSGAGLGDLTVYGSYTARPIHFTGVRMGTISSTIPIFEFVQAAAVANERLWNIAITNNGKNFVIGAVNDAANDSSSPFVIARSGYQNAEIRINCFLSLNRGDQSAREALDVAGNMLVSGRVQGEGGVIGHMTANAGVANQTGGGGVEVRSASGATNAAAIIGFHRQGLYAVNLGLDTDNQLKYGGWSAGPYAHLVYHEGNTPSNELFRHRGVASTSSGGDIGKVAPPNGVGAPDWANGVFRYERGGFSESILQWVCGGSAYVTQLRTHYGGNIAYRVNQDGGQWNPWMDLLSDANYTNYVYSKATVDSFFADRAVRWGENAYGTWPISITGNSNYSNSTGYVDWNNVAGRPNLASSRAPNGYKWLGDTLIVWGATANVASGAQVTFTFPVSFPNACLRVYTTMQNPEVSDDEVICRVMSFNQFSTLLRTQQPGNDTGGFRQVQVFAIGY